jgi:hypothetical protein
MMLLGSRARQVPRPSVSRLSRQCEILNISQPHRHPRPVTGIVLFKSSAIVSKHTPSTGPHTTGLVGRFYIIFVLYIRAKSSKRSGKTATKRNTQVYTCLSSTEANINTDSEHCNTDWNTPIIAAIFWSCRSSDQFCISFPWKRLKNTQEAAPLWYTDYRRRLPQICSGLTTRKDAGINNWRN